MARTTRMIFLAAAATLVSAAPALAQDVAKGEQLFRRCAVCHGIGETTKPIGPNLNNVVGRTAGTLEEFAGKYSPAMVKAGEEGLVWTETDIDEYITNPREKVPGNKMAFPGLRNETERADVIAYLKTFSEPAEEGEAAEPAAAE